MSPCIYEPPCAGACEHQEASTALSDPDVKIKRPRRGSASAASSIPASGRKKVRAEPAAGARLYGNRTTVRVAITFRPAAELWYEVEGPHGSFFVLGTGSIHDLAQRIIEGGYYVRPRPQRKEDRPRRL